MLLDASARVTISTSKGNIEVDLYAKELPKSCRAFLQNCVSKKYNGLEFDTVTSSFIQSQKLPENSEIVPETHSRLKFDGRGCVGLLRHENSRFSSADGFFIGLKPPRELPNHVYIGEVVGESIYNVLKISEVEKKDGTDTPLYPVKILDISVDKTFFTDLKTTEGQVAGPQKRKKQKKALKLDFGDDEEEDFGFEMKSAHETLQRNKTKNTSEPKADQAPAKTTEDYKRYLDLSDDNIDSKALESHNYRPVN